MEQRTTVGKTSAVRCGHGSSPDSYVNSIIFRILRQKEGYHQLQYSPPVHYTLRNRRIFTNQLDLSMRFPENDSRCASILQRASIGAVMAIY